MSKRNYKDEELEDEDLEEMDDDDDDDDEDDDDDDLSLKDKIIKAAPFVVIGIILIIGVVITFSNSKSEPEPKPEIVQPVKEEPIKSQQEQDKEYLNSLGIGKNIGENGVIYQGTIEDDSFRKDLFGEDTPEMYGNKVKISNIIDGVSYEKHRATTGDGIDLYYIDISYKGQKGKTTIPYALYKILPDEGTLDLEVEVVTTENDNVICTYFKPLDVKEYKK